MYIYTHAVYDCPACGRIGHTDTEEDPYTDTVACKICNNEVRHAGEAPYSFVCVAAYDTDRSYGGPEEGGWWYTTGSRDDATVRCFPVEDIEEARTYHDRLRDEYTCVRVYAQQIAPSYFPTQRPFYC